MSLFNNITIDDSIAQDKDVLGGGSRALESNAYDFKIKNAYVTKAASEALGVTLELETDAGEKLKHTEWVTSGKEKGCKNYYIDKKTQEKRYLPGFNNINAVCLLTVGKELSEMEDEERQVMLWNSEAKKEVPTKTPVLVDLLGKEITLGVLKEVTNKTKYNESTKTRDIVEGTVESNTVAKVFRTRDRKTVAEIRGNVEEAVFYSQWVERNAGKTVDKVKDVPATSGVAGAPAAKPKQSLFGA